MNTNILFFVSICVVCLVSCKKNVRASADKVENVFQQEEVKNVPMEVNIDLNSDCLPFDSLMDRVSYVKLETTNDNIIGSISQLLFTQDKIIVVDAEDSKTITVYDKTGRYLNKIGSLGQGPMEYAYLSHVALTPNKELVVVVDMGSGSFKYYNLGGIFIKSVKFPYWFHDCEFLTDDLIAGHYSGGNVLPEENKDYKPLLVVTDLNKNVAYSAFPSYYKKSFTSSISKPLRKFGDHVLYNRPHTDSIFLLTPKGAQLRYLLRIKGVKPIPLNEDLTDQALLEYHKKYPSFDGEMIELADGAIFSLLEFNQVNWARFAIYSYSQQRTFCCNATLYNPFFFFWGVPKARYEENTIVKDVRPDIVLAHKDNLYRLGKKEEIDEFYKDITEDSNPVLIFYHIKF